jgi:serine/threonine-protein kinase
VYVALAGETRQLFRRDMGTGEVAPIPGTQDAQGPFFSPDSEWVGFFAEGKLKKIRGGGDEAQVVADAVWGHGGEWGGDGFIYFCPTELRGISRVPSVGGSPELVTHRTPTDYMHVWPALVPGTRQILVSRVISGAESVAVARLGGEDPPTTLIAGAAGRYAPSGHLVFARQGRLLASTYDVAKAQLIGQPAVMLEDVRTEDRGAVQATWSDDGTLVYARGGDARTARFAWIDREGGRVPLALPTARYGAFAVSPTGATLAYMDPESRVWLHDLKRGGAPRLLTTEGRESRRSWGGPAWEPDGRGLYLEATSPSGPGVFHFATEGSERAPVQVVSGFAQTVAATSAGIVYATKEGIVYLPRGETQEGLDPGRGQLVVAVPDTQMLFPAMSADERWLAYTSDESGHWEVYVTSFPDAGTKRRVSFAGGEEPRWRPDGRAILYRFGSQWYSVAFASDPELALGTPEVLFQGPYVNVDGYSWDMAPDGRRFLVLENPEMGRPLAELTVLTGFFDELRRRLPATP